MAEKGAHLLLPTQPQLQKRWAFIQPSDQTSIIDMRMKVGPLSEKRGKAFSDQILVVQTRVNAIL